MDITQALAVAAAVGESYALFKLLAHIKRTHSVYGISVDFSILQLASSLATVVSGLLYHFSESVNVQYFKRYPLDVDGGATYSILLLVQALELYLAALLAVWVLLKYRATHHCWQYWSVTCMAWLAIWATTIGYFVYCWLRGRATINALDIAEAIRAGGDISRAIRFMPQVTTNIFTSVFKGFPPRWWPLQMVAVALYAVAVVTYHPFVANMPSMVSVYIELMSLICLGIQRMVFVSSSVLPS